MQPPDLDIYGMSAPSPQAAQLEGAQLAVQQQAAELQASQAQLQASQAQLAEADSLVQQQARAIHQLEQQLMREAEQRPAPAPAPPAGVSSASSGSSGSGKADGGGQLATLQAKLGRLQAALELKEEQHARQLRALRQEHERLRVEQGIRCGLQTAALAMAM